MPGTIYGLLNLTDANLSVDQVGQVRVFEAINNYVERHNDDLAKTTSLLVGSTTVNAEESFELPGGGMMQVADRLARPAAVKRAGRYTIGFPLLDARDQLAGDDITYAYMRLEDLETQISNIFVRHINWVRYEMLRAILNNTNYTFEDETLAQRLIGVKALANQDGTIYPPVISNVLDGAQDNHYLVAGYTAATINNTNNPFPVVRKEIVEHFGDGVHVAFINSNQQAVVEALTAFIPFADPAIQQPVDQPRITAGPPTNVPGTVIGRINKTWLSVWDYIPDSYLFETDISNLAPLRKRIDTVPLPGRGVLALIARQQEFPLQEAFWRCRQGFGVANRLNGVVMQFKASGNYDIPTGYTF